MRYFGGAQDDRGAGGGEPGDVTTPQEVIEKRERARRAAADAYAARLLREKNAADAAKDKVDKDQAAACVETLRRGDAGEANDRGVLISRTAEYRTCHAIRTKQRQDAKDAKAVEDKALAARNATLEAARAAKLLANSRTADADQKKRDKEASRAAAEQAIREANEKKETADKLAAANDAAAKDAIRDAQKAAVKEADKAQEAVDDARRAEVESEAADKAAVLARREGQRAASDAEVAEKEAEVAASEARDAEDTAAGKKPFPKVVLPAAAAVGGFLLGGPIGAAVAAGVAALLTMKPKSAVAGYGYYGSTFTPREVSRPGAGLRYNVGSNKGLKTRRIR